MILQKRKSVSIVVCLFLSLIMAAGCPVNGQAVNAAAKKGKTLIVYFTRGDNVKSKQ